MRPVGLEIVKKDRPKPTPATPADEQRGARRRSVTGRALLAVAALAAALALTAGGPARGADGGGPILSRASWLGTRP